MTLHADLTPEQRDAVLHRDGPLLILAGAGSGKTRVITRRVAHLIRTGARPGSIVAITFTNKAAGEMRERIHALVPDVAAAGRDGPVVATFHAFAVRLLRELGPRAGIRKDFSILDEDDQLALVREAAVAARVDVERFRAPALSHAIGRAKEKLDDAAFAAQATSDLDRAAAAVLPVYRDLQRARNALDFEDLVAQVVLLLERDPDALALVQGRLEFVLVDEYQDTNHAQYRLARLLAGPRRNICVCGDPDQSIYGWRGADMGNILRFEEDFPGAKVVLLERNYRSSPTILEAANHLIGHNAVRKDKQLRPGREEDGLPIEVRRCLDEDLEADYVARRVEEVIAMGTSPHEVAVVYRAGKQAERYEEALLKRNVPCATAGAVSFFDRAEIKDALALVKLAVNPRDDLAALRALRSTRKGVGKATLDKVHELQRRHGVSIVEACGRAGELPTVTRATREALLGFAALVREVNGAASGPAAPLVQKVLERSGLEAALRQGGEDGAARADNLGVLVDAARDADRRAARGGEAGARGFLDRLALLDGQDRKDEEAPDKVTLTTVHAAKGLEFDVVFVVGLEQGLFPHERALAEGQLEEERRLAYVAFTRARKRLVLTYAGLRKARNPADERRRPSTFIYELPPTLLWDPERRAPADLPEREAEQPAAPAAGGGGGTPGARARPPARAASPGRRERAPPRRPCGPAASSAGPPPAVPESGHQRRPGDMPGRAGVHFPSRVGGARGPERT
ncbi:MAG: UvrD-helicase domain-containing protein [Planctomycetes bacterium]|nr:UvrD-helicase domain-containing protein [Planctomycetota bacterium]